MGAVHLRSVLAVQAVMTLTAVVGLVLYYRRPQAREAPRLACTPDGPAEEWAGAFPEGFALALATVTDDHFDETQGAFLENDLIAPRAVDCRPVL